ncbi:MAG: ImmA/IrrE family metallo-endopeptidase [Miltoncostaeaceae bacterium]
MAGAGAEPSGERRPDHGAADLLRARFGAVYGECPVPVPVEGIAEDLLGLRVVAGDLGRKDGWSVSGVLDVGQRLLWVAAAEPDDRRRFTIAHEIGHWECHRDGRQQLCLFDAMPADGDGVEREANMFAATLLMPADAVADAHASLAREAGDDPAELVHHLAGLFRVSIPAMEWRLYNLQLGPRPTYEVP